MGRHVQRLKGFGAQGELCCVWIGGEGPKRAYYVRSTTRAQYVRSLVEELYQNLIDHTPQLPKPQNLFIRDHPIKGFVMGFCF